MPKVEAPVEKWRGRVQEVRLGGDGRKQVIVGGESTLPFLHFDGEIPHRPVIAAEVLDMPPVEWAENVVSAWGDALKSPTAWAKKAAAAGADLIFLRLASAHPEQGNTSGAQAAKTVAQVMEATNLPLIVVGPDVAEKDNEVIVAVAEAARGQRLALGTVTDKNYRTIVATAMAGGHAVIAQAPMDMNLSKQLNILCCDMGLPKDSLIMDPTTGALGYGMEYALSVFERLRLAALQGDTMTAMPILCHAGYESWRQKEAKAVEGVPATWGDQKLRSLLWEQMTALTLLESGAEIVVLRHPRSMEIVRGVIDRLMAR